MKRLIEAAACAAASMSMCACATITRGTHTDWVVQTTPSGAAVKTTNGMYCAETPCSLRMDRKASFIATISKDGYQPVEIPVHHKMSTAGGAGFVGNALVGGVIGGGIDVAMGSELDLAPNPVILTLQPIPAPPPPPTPPHTADSPAPAPTRDAPTPSTP
jgi:hypothetical protein